MPEKMALSNANYLGNAITADTRARGYNDYVNAGLNDASRGARESPINLDKVVADQTLARLRGEATAKGFQTPEAIANYVHGTVDPAEVAASPYWADALLTQRRQTTMPWL